MATNAIFMKNPLFYAKILLFGEYGIIEDAKGLTIPYNFYKGALKFESKAEAKASNEILLNYAAYLEENTAAFAPLTFDLPAFRKDLAQGMFFDSNIPQGYGVGSSGALVAAIYDKYVQGKIVSSDIVKEDISRLKMIFSLMESFFHGKSSGIDPLICYLNIPLLINSKTDIDKVGLPSGVNGKGGVFLINSGKPGKTAPLVEYFFERLKNEGFRKTLKEEFIKYNDACIDSFVRGDISPLFMDLKKLSTWVMINFKPMIPSKVMHIWEQGIQTNVYYLKLCGSGGGGYVLGFTKDYEKTKELLKDYDTELIYSF